MASNYTEEAIKQKVTKCGLIALLFVIGCGVEDPQDSSLTSTTSSELTTAVLATTEEERSIRSSDGEVQSIPNFWCVKGVIEQALEYRDPLNHCYAACELRSSCGVSASGVVILSYAKEICDLIGWKGFCHDFSFGDLWADLQGIGCSYEFWRSCYDCCPKP